MTMCTVGGMTCGACARRVRTALETLPEVRAAYLDLSTGSAVIETEGGTPSFEKMHQVVANAGYTFERARGEGPKLNVPVGPFLFGALAVASLLSLYLGLLTLAQGWSHAIEQLQEDRWFVTALTIGFGTQVGLFVYLRSLQASATAGGVAASTGASTAAMLACCAHHLTDILPVLGVAGAAAFLAAYKTQLLWVGIIMNALGVAYMLWQIRRQRVRSCATGSQGTQTVTPSPR
jgi:cation transport ATPase